MSAKCGSVLVTILLSPWSIAAQSGFTGTWQADVVDPPWAVALRVDGSTVTGRVSQCAGPGAVEVSEGRIDAGAVTFKCSSRDGQRTVSITGRLAGDNISFTWVLNARDGGSPVAPNEATRSAMFGPSSPATFTARRVPDGPLAATLRGVIGTELAAAVNLKQQNVKASSVLFLSNRTSRVRGVIVLSSWGLGDDAYYDNDWRRCAEALDFGLLLVTFSRISGQDAGQESQGAIPERAGADAVELLLRRVAEESSNPELANAPLILWGHSAGGQLGSRMASLLSQRTIAFIHYHTNGGVREGQVVLQKIPALLFVGGKDPAASTGRAEAAWSTGRSAGAPWTFAPEPDAEHENPAHLKKANDLLIPWITAVVRLRLSPKGLSMQPIAEREAWAGDHRTREVLPYDKFPGSKAGLSWLPDEASARAWQTVTGRGK